MSSDIKDEITQDNLKREESLEEQMQKEQTLLSDMLFDFKNDWKKSDPSAAPLLSKSSSVELNGIKEVQANLKNKQQKEKRTAQSAQKAVSMKSDQQALSVSDKLSQINLASFPFHHLIPAEKLSLGVIAHSLQTKLLQEDISRKEQSLIFWKAMADQNISPAEAVLFDSEIECVFFEADRPDESLEIKWAARHFNEIEGCAEIYRAEMLIFKRFIYEAGENLKTVVEIKEEELLPFFDEQVFSNLSRKSFNRLFFDNLFASFSISLLSTTLADTKQPNKKVASKSAAKKSNADIAFSYISRMSSRIESLRGSGDQSEEKAGAAIIAAVENSDYEKSENGISADFTEDNEKREKNNKDKRKFGARYRLDLTDYWLNWQKPVRAAKFDFQLLEDLEDVRAMRFYELSKLLRGFSALETGGVIPDKLTITYENFVSLMPLPALRYDTDIKAQIREITKPLKTSGYLKSFSLKTDWREMSGYRQLVFIFSD